MPGLSPHTIFAGRYKLVQLLGIGGYSEVWKAIDNMAGEMHVALKIFAPGKGLDSTGIKVFSSEYSLVFNLSHSGLLQAKHYDIWEGSPYLVMAYCANGSVYGKIGEMTEPEVLQFIEQAAAALDYLHNQPTPIIHQDIKPDNFLISDSGNYLLSDFGISSRLRRTLTRSVGNEGSAGTMAYLPPERFNQNKQVLPAGDIFALGVTAYELLSGDLPFDDQGGLRLKNGADIPDLPQNFSPQLNALVRSCLNTDPALRPDAKSLEIKATALSNSLKNGTPAPLRNKPLSEPRKTVQIPYSATPPIPKIPDDSAKKKPTWPPIIGILLFIVGFILLMVFDQNNRSQSEDLAKVYEDTTATIDTLPNDAAEMQRVADSTSKAQMKVSKQTVINSSDNPIKKNIPTQEDYNQVKAPETNTRLSIGQKYAGGIIFYLDGSRLHGLVCAPNDLRKKVDWFDAKYFCKALSCDGFNDWYLPSKKELDLVYNNLHLRGIGDFVNDYYWSSSINGTGDAIIQYFGSGGFDNGPREFGYHVRAIRAF